MNGKSPRLIQSVQRAIDIMNCFDSLHAELSLSEISKKLNLNISTVYGIIHTLCANSYMEKNADNGKYKLGLEFLLKANLVSDNLDLKEIGYPHLLELTSKYQETTHLYVYQNGQLFCVGKVESPSNYFIVSSRAVGKLALHASASGKIFLAYMKEEELERFLENYSLKALTDKTITDKAQLMENLREIRCQGYSIEDEEIERGAYSIAAPVKNAANQVVGTISVIGSKLRIQENEQNIRKDLLNAASSISSRYGHQAANTMPSYDSKAVN